MTPEHAFAEELRKKLNQNLPDKLLVVAEAIRRNINIKNVYKSTKIDPLFLEQISDLVKIEKKLKRKGIPKTFKEFSFVKSLGFSDSKIAELTKNSIKTVQKRRRKLKIFPVFKKII